MSIRDYIWKAKYQQPGEKDISDTFRRVAKYISSAEPVYSDYWEKKFFEIMNQNRFLPGGRILANAGTKIKNLSNCFVLEVRDSRQSIFQALKDAADVYAWGGGIGYNFSHLREKGAPISIGGKSSGVLSFMKIFNEVADVIKIRSRRGATMGQLDVSHPEIEDFIWLKSKLSDEEEKLIELMSSEEDREKLHRYILSKKFTHFNISVRISDEFMRAVKENKDWKLISPLSGEVRKVMKAKDLFGQIALSAWSSGDPGVVFIDRIDEDEMMLPIWGSPEGSNPCQLEGTLNVDGDRLHRIGDISNAKFTGEYAWTEDGPSPIYEANTYYFWKTGYKDVIRLITNAGIHIELTPDHKILAAEGKDGKYEYMWIEAKDALNKKIVLGIRDYKEVMRKAPQNKKVILLGFLFGDGTLEASGKVVHVDITPEKEPEVADLLREFGFTERESDKYSFHSFRMPISKFVEIFGKESLDLIQKTDTKEIPEWVFYKDIEWIRDFITGVYEANGSTNSNGQILFKTISEKLADQLQQLLLLFGVFSWKVENKPVKIKWYNGEYISRRSWNLQIAPRNGKAFLYTIGFLSERKNRNIKILDKKYGVRVRVTSIQYIGKGNVWDFKMKQEFGRDWNYTQGFVCHNCSELYLYPYESCNLGSINLVEHLYKEGDKYFIDWGKLFETVRVATRFLGDVVDLDRNIVEKINETRSYLRRIGLGVMGLADLFLLMDIPYGSEESLELAQRIMWFISVVSIMESNYLARIKGPAKFWVDNKLHLNYRFIDKVFDLTSSRIRKFMEDTNLVKLVEDSKELYMYDGNWLSYPLRNVSWTSIAPTGSLAILAEVSHAIEPYYKLVYRRNLELGEDKVQKVEFIKNHFVDLKLREIGLSESEIARFYTQYSEGGIESVDVLPEDKRKLFVDSHSLSPKEHVDVQSALQEFVSNSISKTVNMPNLATVEDVEDIFMYMWEKRVKSSTIYRDGSKVFQVLN